MNDEISIPIWFHSILRVIGGWIGIITDAGYHAFTTYSSDSAIRLITESRSNHPSSYWLPTIYKTQCDRWERKKEMIKKEWEKGKNEPITSESFMFRLRNKSGQSTVHSQQIPLKITVDFRKEIQCSLYFL